MATKKLSYSLSLGPENDLFKPTAFETGSFPVRLYNTVSPKYSALLDNNPIFNQLDIRVSISSIQNTPDSTRVYSNSANLLATDIQFNGIWYFYKHKISTSAHLVLVDGIEYTNKDDNFLYFIDQTVHTIEYVDSGVIILTEQTNLYPIFIGVDYLGLANIYSIDNKTLSIGKTKGTIQLTYTRPNIHVEEADANIFDVFIVDNQSYPTIMYFPFYVSLNIDNNQYEYDYTLVSANIKTINGVRQYFYKNYFTLFDYTKSGLIDFRDNKYPSYSCYIGFNKTKDNTTTYTKNISFTVLVNDHLVNPSSLGVTITNTGGTYFDTGTVLPDGTDQDQTLGFNIIPSVVIDSSVIYSSTKIHKNDLDLALSTENPKQALITIPKIIKDRIPSIDKNIYRKCLPSSFFLSEDEEVPVLPNIPGQDVESLGIFTYIEGSEVADNIFKFDISRFAPFIDTSTGRMNTGFLFDYTQSDIVKDYLAAYKPFTDTTFDYELNIEDIYLYVSNDKQTYTFVSKYHYNLIIDSTVSELTVNINTNILDSYKYVTIGFLKKNINIISSSVVEL